MTTSPTPVLPDARAREVLQSLVPYPLQFEDDPCADRYADNVPVAVAIAAMLAFAKEATPPASEAAVPAGEWSMIQRLRDEEADSVTILCDNPDGPPNAAVECCGFWTGFAERRFEGDNIGSALQAAVCAKDDAARVGYPDTAAASKVASDTGAGLRDKIRLIVLDAIHQYDNRDGWTAQDLANDATGSILEALATPTDATDGATGEVPCDLHKAFSKWCGHCLDVNGYRGPEDATTPGADLLEQAARVADVEATRLDAIHADYNRTDTNRSAAWNQAIAARRIAAAIRALSARNQTDDGAEK